MPSIFPNRQVTDQWKYPTKMERHFPIKPDQPTGMAVTYFSPFPNFLIRARNRFVKNGTESFDRNSSVEISGPPLEVIDIITVRRNRNGSFHLNSGRNFRNLWKNGKHPLTQTQNECGQSGLLTVTLDTMVGAIKFPFSKPFTFTSRPSSSI